MKEEEKNLQKHVADDMEYIIKRFFTYPVKSYEEHIDDQELDQKRKEVERLFKKT